MDNAYSSPPEFILSLKFPYLSSYSIDVVSDDSLTLPQKHVLLSTVQIRLILSRFKEMMKALWLKVFTSHIPDPREM